MVVQAAVKPSLTLKRRFKAPPAKVFAAFTDPEKVKRWIGPGEMKGVIAETDARAGGGYRWVMQSPVGQRLDVGGVFREVVPNEKLVFSWAWKVEPPDTPHESLVTVLFKADGDGTLLTLIHENLFDDDSRNGHQQGWIGAFDKLEKFVA
ncbi:MAG TPA: SRPBCC domain-containing protein [Xanthobacteraceae bacterium]|nr:SRPBCC domain-containing protein [Xanthobacteraceae bacterium]